MSSKSATTRWTGDVATGEGETALGSGAATFTVAHPDRAEAGEGRTSPEELLAAAHAACVAMAFRAVLAADDLEVHDLEVTAEVHQRKVPDGLAIIDVELRLLARVPGLDAEQFQVLAAKAEKTCPVSKALAATEIAFSAQLL